MKRYSGANEVPGGYYFNPRTWSIAVVSGDRGMLEGNPSDRLVRLPLLAVLPLALALSLVFVMFLPFIGFALLAYSVGRPAATGGLRLVRNLMTRARARHHALRHA